MKICVCLCVCSLPSFVFDSEIHVSSINFINGKRFFCIYHIPNSFPKLKSVPVCLECCYLKYCILSKSFCLKYGITLTLTHISAVLFQKLVIDLKKIVPDLRFMEKYCYVHLSFVASILQFHQEHYVDNLLRTLCWFF